MIYSLRVHYEDTDFSGYVYHANYLKFCERARSEYLRNKGVDQNAMFKNGEAFVVRRMACDFLKPARFEDELSVETDFRAMSGACFDLVQAIKRSGITHFTAEVTVVLIDARGKPKRISQELAKALLT